ncbi:MAG: hypothetical protein M3447_02595, partial [Acidobacteriota bacterium]|nr:hypothetical protein [Acidobacteriota bacterium]
MKNFRLLMVLTVSVLVVCTLEPSASAQGQIDATKVLQVQQVDYVERERRASPEVKARIASLRQDAKSRNRRYTVGYTTALDVPLEILAGTRIPKDFSVGDVNKRATELRQIDVESARIAKVRDLTLAPCSANATSWDWRKRGKVTPIKSQICGTCWDFTAMGAYEGSYALRNNQMINTSEQYVLRCAGAGGCAGGWWMPVFDFMMSNGTATEAALPFSGVEGSCPTGLSLPYRAVAWGFVAPSGQTATIPTAAQTKQALCDHGPLAVALMADAPFQAYTGGVFDETDKTFDWIN